MLVVRCWGRRDGSFQALVATRSSTNEHSRRIWKCYGPLSRNVSHMINRNRVDAIEEGLVIISNNNAMAAHVADQVLQMRVRIDFILEWDDRTNAEIRVAVFIKVEDISFTCIGVNNKIFWLLG